MKALLLAAALAAIPLSALPATSATIAMGGGFANKTHLLGVVNGVNDYNSALLDDTGLTAGTLVNFSLPAIFPFLGETVSLTTPNYGAVSFTFTGIDYLHYYPSGEFFEMTGHVNVPGASWAILDVNLPYFSRQSFGLLAQWTPYVSPPPPPIDPPPCVDCGPPPPCLTCNPPPCLTCGPPPVVTAPEPSTWAMMGIGFLGLAWASYRRSSRAPARLAA